MKYILLSAAVSAALLYQQPAQAFEWVNNSVGFRYGKQFTNPNNPHYISKRVFTFTHADGYRYGSNFLNIDVLLSDSNDPRKGTDHGSSEVYAVYRNQLFASRVLDIPKGDGLIKDYALTLGFDANRNNNLGSSNKRAVVVGPTLKFNSVGVLDLSLMYYREHNQSGIPGVRDKELTFDGTYALNLTWLRPFQVGTHNAKFQGTLNHIGEKGKDYNDRDTAAETLLRSSLLFALRPGEKTKPNLWLGVGYEYWHNKFGVDGGRGSRTSTPTFNMEISF
ncbi:nucleoside-binding protein [Pseudomonas sp. JQ170]|uniref:nucleoside-binding protein n=1 Tax=Pseudomonas sp. JQ170 TaxID=2828861 RepID=UPI00264E1A7F|nr:MULTISPECIES: nucleoside-binding protein [unclassified Pseudomonas]MDN7143348.1 nucleoside-binding protein [Pseudomonas sp. JQ170]WRO78434.1 nucleoside-binding protein [Pseudomonas sp. 170C]